MTSWTAHDVAEELRAKARIWSTEAEKRQEAMTPTTDKEYRESVVMDAQKRLTAAYELSLVADKLDRSTAPDGENVQSLRNKIEILQQEYVQSKYRSTEQGDAYDDKARVVDEQIERLQARVHELDVSRSYGT